MKTGLVLSSLVFSTTLLAQAAHVDLNWMPLINAGAAVVCVGLVVWIQVWGGPAERKAFTEELERMRAALVSIAAHNSDQRALQRKHDDERWNDQRKHDYDMWEKQRAHDKANRDNFGVFIIKEFEGIDEKMTSMFREIAQMRRATDSGEHRMPPRTEA